MHNDTYYGKIVNPISGTLCTVQRVKIEGERLSDIKKIIPAIVDPSIRAIVNASIEQLSLEGVSVVGPSTIKMPSGVPIRKVRIIAPSKFKSPDAIRQHSFISTKVHKQFIYAGSAENVNFRMAVYCLQGKYSYQTESKLYWAQNHKSAEYIPLDQIPGFIGYVYPGSMVLIHSGGGIDEVSNLLQLPAILAKRLYYVRTLPTTKEKRSELQVHLEARAKKDIPDSDKASVIECESPKRLLRVTANDEMFSQLLFEGIHFRMMLDGTIQFIRR